jgi:hypothetical protein
VGVRPRQPSGRAVPLDRYAATRSLETSPALTPPHDDRPSTAHDDVLARSHGNLALQSTWRRRFRTRSTTTRGRCRRSMSGASRSRALVDRGADARVLGVDIGDGQSVQGRARRDVPRPFCVGPLAHGASARLCSVSRAFGADHIASFFLFPAFDFPHLLPRLLSLILSFRSSPYCLPSPPLPSSPQLLQTNPPTYLSPPPAYPPLRGRKVPLPSPDAAAAQQTNLMSAFVAMRTRAVPEAAGAGVEAVLQRTEELGEQEGKQETYGAVLDMPGFVRWLSSGEPGASAA